MVWVESIYATENNMKHSSHFIPDPSLFRPTWSERTLQSLLAEKKAQLKEVMDMLEELNAQFEEANNKKLKLERDAQQCADRLERAEKLLGALGGVH